MTRAIQQSSELPIVKLSLLSRQLAPSQLHCHSIRWNEYHNDNYAVGYRTISPWDARSWAVEVASTLRRPVSLVSSKNSSMTETALWRYYNIYSKLLLLTRQCGCWGVRCAKKYWYAGIVKRGSQAFWDVLLLYRMFYRDDNATTDTVLFKLSKPQRWYTINDALHSRDYYYYSWERTANFSAKVYRITWNSFWRRI